MSNSVIGALRVMLGMDTAEFEDGSKKAQREAKALERKFEAIGGNMQKVGLGMTAALTAPLVAFAAKGLQEAQQSAAAIAQVEAALTSMGPVAGRTSEQLQDAANAFEGSSLFEADVILKEITANLLTFGNIAGEQFDRAQQAAIDMATRLGSEPQAAAIALGKALNDPVKGITSLTRVGVQFTEAQKAQIKEMTALGDAAGAQGIILAELERQFGGAAQAAQNTDPLNRFNDAVNSLAELVGNVLLPVLTPIVDGLADFASSFGELPQEVQTTAVAIGAVVAAAGPLLVALGGIVSIWPAITAGFAAATTAALPVAAAVAAVAAAGYLIYENWDRIAPVLEETAASFQSAIGPDLQRIIDEASAKLTALWNGPLGEMLRTVGAALIDFQLGYMSVLGEGLKRVLDAAINLVGGAFNLILDSLIVVSRFLSGDFAGAWEAMKTLVTGVVTSVAGAIEALFPGLIQLGKDIIRGIVNGIKAAPGAVRDALLGVIQSGVTTVKDFLGIRSPSLLFFEVGSNIIRGLVNGISQGQGPVANAFAMLGDETEVQTVRIADTVGQMVQNISGHLRGLAGGIKSGNFWDILDGIIGIGSSLGQAGVFGKGVQSFLGSVPGFATGGTMKLGGLGGIDRNVLSLNGSPIARVSAGETMQIRAANDRGGGTTVVNNYYTLPSEEFWGRVDGRAAGVAGPIAQATTARAFDRARAAQARTLV